MAALRIGSCTLAIAVALFAVHGLAGAQEPVAVPAAPAPDTAAAPAEAAPAAPAGPAPKIECPEPVYNFGEADTDTSVEHAFVIRNAGDAALEIRDVKSSCGCTVAKLEEKTLAPGGETTVKATLSLKGRSGPMNKTITVMSNDPTQPNMQLRLEGSAVSPIVLEPRVVSLGRVLDGMPAEQVVKIRPGKQGVEFKILNVKCDTPQFETKVVPAEGESGYDLHLTAAQPLPEGQVNALITIDTDHAQKNMLDLRVFGIVVGNFDVAPQSINLVYNANPSARSTQHLSVSPGRIKQFKVTEVIAPIESMHTEIQEMAGNRFLIKLADMPNNDELDGKELVIKTDSAEQPEIQVPIKVIHPRTPVTVPVAPPAPAPAATPAPAPATTPAPAAG